MTTLEDALNCIKVQKENGTYDEFTRIGIMSGSYHFFDARYEPGMHVLYKQGPESTLVLEMPLKPESIGIHQMRGSTQTTCYAVWNVPEKLVERVESV